MKKKVAIVLSVILACSMSMTAMAAPSPSIQKEPVAQVVVNPTVGTVPVLYAGVMSCGVAYTLQIIGQKHLDPTVASLILSLESVVSVLAGWVILGETLNLKEIFGCVLVFAAVILVQLPEKAGEAALMSGADS